MESLDFEESEKEYLKIKIKNIKETLESFKEYLDIVIKTVDKGNHNEDMVNDLCKMINKYYKNLESDEESSGSSEDEESTGSSENEESSNSSENGESSNSSEEESSDKETKTQKKVALSKPFLLKNINKELIK